MSKIVVPTEYSRLAASYRYGYQHGSEGHATEREGYFKTSEALTAYKAGYEAGVKARLKHHIERAKANDRERTITGPLFSK